MNLSAIATASILLGAAGVFAEDGSSILKGAISSAFDALNLRGGYSQYCDSYTPCPSNKFCKMPDGQCSYTADADEMSEVFVKTSPPIGGQCERRPDLPYCIEGEDPEVCGCDGLTYLCRKDAYWLGINVDYVGACGGPSESEARYIVNSASPNRRVIETAQASCDPGTNINLFHQTGQDHQKWIYHYDTGIIESAACPGMVLDIEGGVNSGCEPESNIVLWYDTGAEWQQWMYSPDGKLISMYCDDMVIDIYNGNDVNGANIQLFSENTNGDGWNQVWSFE